MSDPTATPPDTDRWSIEDFDPVDEAHPGHPAVEAEHDCTGEPDMLPEGVDMDVTLPPSDDPFSELPHPPLPDGPQPAQLPEEGSDDGA